MREVMMIMTKMTGNMNKFIWNMMKAYDLLDALSSTDVAVRLRTRYNFSKH